MSTKIDLVNCAEACAIVGGNQPISRSFFYEGIAAGRFPQPVKIGPHAVRWQRQELELALASLVAARPRPAPRKRVR